MRHSSPIFASNEPLSSTLTANLLKNISHNGENITSNKPFFLVLSHFFYSSLTFTTNFVWKSQVLFKVKSFIQLVAHKKLNTNVLLQLRRSYKALSLNICKLCIKYGEPTYHLFLHCPLTMGLWHKLFSNSQDGLGPLEEHFRHYDH